MLGMPWAGKSMLTRRLITILPAMTLCPGGLASRSRRAFYRRNLPRLTLMALVAFAARMGIAMGSYPSRSESVSPI
jgi:hypothetical protein